MHSIQQYEYIQELIARGQLNAEKKWGKKPYGRPWSPIISSSGKWITVLRKLHHKVVSGGNFSQADLDKWHNLGHIDSPTTNTINGALKQAWKDFKKVKKVSQKLREDFLSERAAFYVQQKNKSMVQVLNNIKNIEAVRNTFAKLKFVTKPDRSGNISHLIIPTDDNMNTRILTDESEIHTHLLEDSSKVFAAFHHTFPESLPFRLSVGDSGENLGMRQLLNNIPVPCLQKDSQNINQWLVKLQYDTDSKGQIPPQLDPCIDGDQICTLLRKTNEWKLLPHMVCI